MHELVIKCELLVATRGEFADHHGEIRGICAESRPRHYTPLPSPPRFYSGYSFTATFKSTSKIPLSILTCIYFSCVPHVNPNNDVLHCLSGGDGASGATKEYSPQITILHVQGG